MTSAKDFQVRPAEAADGDGIAESHIASIRSLGAKSYDPEIVDAWGAPRSGDRYRRAMERGEFSSWPSSAHPAGMTESSASLLIDSNRESTAQQFTFAVMQPETELERLFTPPLRARLDSTEPEKCIAGRGGLLPGEWFPRIENWRTHAAKRQENGLRIHAKAPLREQVAYPEFFKLTCCPPWGTPGKYHSKSTAS